MSLLDEMISEQVVGTVLIHIDARRVLPQIRKKLWQSI